jgi:hypothetical protein
MLPPRLGIILAAALLFLATAESALLSHPFIQELCPTGWARYDGLSDVHLAAQQFSPGFQTEFTIEFWMQLDYDNAASAFVLLSYLVEKPPWEEIWSIRRVNGAIEMEWSGKTVPSLRACGP